MSIRIVVKKNTYFDSVSLMSISTRANKLDGVEQAFVAMATEMNKGVLKNLGLLTPELEEAFHQRYRESVARLVTHIITRQHHVATPFITDIKNIGSSSGCDMLYGMADACALSHRSGGNYVDQDSC